MRNTLRTKTSEFAIQKIIVQSIKVPKGLRYEEGVTPMLDFLRKKKLSGSVAAQESKAV
jgi:hypothetical protein